MSPKQATSLRAERCFVGDPLVLPLFYANAAPVCEQIKTTVRKDHVFHRIDQAVDALAP
jgi:hypothetical protein